MPRPRIISIGSANLDVQVRADNWPGKGESDTASDCLLASGGKAANVAYLARKLGAEVQLVARVGDDLLADRILAPLADLGVELSDVRRTENCLSGVALIRTSPDGQKSVLFAANANNAWDAADEEDLARLMKRAPQGSVVVVDFEITRSVAARAVDAAREAGLRVLVDPAPPSEVSGNVLAKTDYLTPDAHEAQELTGIEVSDPKSALAAAEALCGRGVHTAIVKLSGGGCVVADPSFRALVELERAAPVDVTGAGDAFAAALAVALLENRPLAESVRTAAAAAKIATTRYGAQNSYPDRRQLEKAAAHIEVREA